ncbi:MAG: uroporphyrinogen decarboxylase [Bifidobacteriaceae bacterium]|nr:uroporphyrinogen decarboxylase [Bifidobacteriaceae bacterium]
MPAWTRRDRFAAALAGEAADRPPVSAWRHFVGSEYSPEELARSTEGFARHWDWDWVKVNPRITFYSEAWGSEFDPADYHDVLPRLVSSAIVILNDLGRIEAVDPRASAAFADQIDAARRVRAALPDRPVLSTVFSPLTVLLQLAGLSTFSTAGLYGSSEPISRANLLGAPRGALDRALGAVAETLAAYVEVLVSPEVGLDGVFYAVTGTPGLVSRGEHERLSRPHDLKVLEAAGGAARILHTCGANSHPEWFGDYPVEALHWDQHAEGNPGLGEDFGPATMGGVDHMALATGSAEAMGRQTAEALRARGGRPFLLAPSCSVPLDVREANLAAFGRAARRGEGSAGVWEKGERREDG